VVVERTRRLWMSTPNKKDNKDNKDNKQQQTTTNKQQTNNKQTTNKHQTTNNNKQQQTTTNKQQQTTNNKQQTNNNKQTTNKQQTNNKQTTNNNKQQTTTNNKKGNHVHQHQDHRHIRHQAHHSSLASVHPIVIALLDLAVVGAVSGEDVSAKPQSTVGLTGHVGMQRVVLCFQQLQCWWGRKSKMKTPKNMKVSSARNNNIQQHPATSSNH
jgi:DNA mismatch repair ATPase MutL